MNNMSLVPIILFILLLIIFCRKCAKRYWCSRCRYMRPNNQQLYFPRMNGGSSTCGGLNEIKQDTIMRGAVPFSNQPNHVMNMWKSGYSHPQVDNKGRSCTSFSSDYRTPLRNRRDNLDTQDNSSMYLISRFATL